MYTISQPSSAPVHNFGSGAGTGPPAFGTSAPAGAKTFTGGNIPSSSPYGDMGNVLTHKQSSRVVVDTSSHINDYAKQCNTLVEKEFSVIQIDCRSELHASAPPGDHAVISSLACSNHKEMIRTSAKHGNSKSEESDNLLTHMQNVRYEPFGPVIQTDKASKQLFGQKQCVTNVAIGGRANFANCFIRTAGLADKSPSAAVNVGDAVYMATYVFTCPPPDNGSGGISASIMSHHEKDDCVYRTFNFLIVDNDYSMIPIPPSPVTIDKDPRSCKVAMRDFLEGCMGNPDHAKALCTTLCCSFSNPGVNISNIGSMKDKHIHVCCTSIACVGTIIECPIPNAHNEHPQTVLRGMINDAATMSTTHPVSVQMTS